MSHENIKPSMIEANNLSTVEQSRKILSEKYPRLINEETNEINSLARVQKDIKKRFMSHTKKSYNFVNEVARTNGIEDVFISPDSSSYFEYSISRDCFIFPEKCLSPLGELLNFADQDYPKKFAAKSLDLLIEAQSEFLKGDAFKELNKSKELKEELYNLDETMVSSKKVVVEMIYHQSNLQNMDEKIRSVLNKRVHKKMNQIKEVIYKKTNLEDELGESNLNISKLVYSQFVEKIEKDPSRDVVEDMATLITFTDLTQDEDVFLSLVSKKKMDEDEFDMSFNKIITDKNTRRNIINKCAEIRGKLLASN